MTEINPYAAPSSTVATPSDFAAPNTSGLGAGHPIPDGVRGWSWGAFVWGWLWAVFNQTWVGLCCLVPYIGLGMKVYLGFKGRELAWQNKRWDSLEHFNAVQRKWSLWAWLIVVIALAGIAAAVILPALNR